LRHLERCNHRELFRDLNLVAKLQATTNSGLIECKYILRVATEYESCTCCCSTPTIDIPVVLYIPEDISFNFNNYRPQNWNPVVMQQYEFKLPNDPNFNSNMNNNQMNNVQISNNNQPYNNNQGMLNEPYTNTNNFR
jgi:hypothetical protein